MLTWTPELTSRVVSLWREGKSAAEISETLNLTRSTVVGKLNRMGELGKKRERVRKPVSRRKPVIKVETGTWDLRTFESWENRKIRLAHERAQRDRVTS